MTNVRGFMSRALADAVGMSKKEALFEAEFAETEDLHAACLASGITTQDALALINRDGVTERIESMRSAIVKKSAGDVLDTEWVLKSIRQAVEYALADSKYASAIAGLTLCTKILKMVDNDTTNVVVVQPPQIIKLFGVDTEVPYDPNLIIEGVLEKK